MLSLGCGVLRPRERLYRETGGETGGGQGWPHDPAAHSDVPQLQVAQLIGQIADQLVVHIVGDDHQHHVRLQCGSDPVTVTRPETVMVSACSRPSGSGADVHASSVNAPHTAPAILGDNTPN